MSTEGNCSRWYQFFNEPKLGHHVFSVVDVGIFRSKCSRCNIYVAQYEVKGKVVEKGLGCHDFFIKIITTNFCSEPFSP